MLNMIDTQDKLKNFSEQQLIQEMQRPSGSAPQFMVLGEIERRKRMRADAQRQEGLMQPTVAQEAVSAAGVPQQGIAQVAQSLAPQTDMTQNTGVPNVQAAGLPGQPNQPQRMADGGILRLAPGGGLSGGTISAIASLKVNRPDIYEEYKDDPEALAMVAEYFNFPATDSERTGLESIEAPYVDPYGPQGLAQRTAAAEVGNQARLASDAKRAMPLTRDEKILADAQAAIKKYSTNAGRDAAGNLLPVAPDSDLTRAIEQRERDEADEFFFNAGMFDRAAPENVAAQPRGSELAAELSAISAAEDLRQRIAQEDAAMAMPIPQSGIAAATSPRTQTAADIANETALRNREMASENAGRLTAEELITPFSETGLGSVLTSAQENLPDLAPFVGQTKEAFSDPAAAFNREMAARQAAGERNYANAVQGVEALNQRIANAKADGNEILAQQLTTARDQLGGTLRNQERKEDVTEAVLAIPQSINKAFQQSSLGVGLRGPDATARTLTALGAEQKAAKEAEATRERRLAELLGGATPTSTAAAKAAQEEFSQRPDTQDVKPAAEQKKIADAIKTVTDPAAMPPAIKSGTGGTSTGKKSGILAEKSKMDQDKWLALAQAGFTLMSTGDFGKAGSTGLAALREAQKGDREERKLEAELTLREAQLAKANRAPAAKAIPAAYLTDLRKQMEAKQAQLASLRPPEEGGLFSSGSDPDAATRKLLTDQIRSIQGQIDFMYSSRGLPTVSNTATRTKV